MVDVAAKDNSARTATARGRVRLSKTAFERLRSGVGRKGDAAAVAELAGIMGAKKTSDLIPLCHPLPMHGANVTVETEEKSLTAVVTASVKTTGKTGVEMEALTAVSIACLTLYDMLKSVDKSMVIDGVELVEKTGGASGDYRREDGLAAS